MFLGLVYLKYLDFREDFKLYYAFFIIKHKHTVCTLNFRKLEI